MESIIIVLSVGASQLSFFFKDNYIKNNNIINQVLSKMLIQSIYIDLCSCVYNDIIAVAVNYE